MMNNETSYFQTKYPYMALHKILEFENDMIDQNVSVVSRNKGFFKKYNQVKGRPFAMGYVKGNKGEKWLQRRENFINRHLAQANNNNESLYKADGQPTRRTLSFYAWAFDPSPQLTRRARIIKKRK